MADTKQTQRLGLPTAWQTGFTLIELMVVLVIIGLLAALVVPNVLNRADDARVTAARTDITQLMQALKLYRLDNLRYPTAEQGLAALVKKPDNGPQPLNWKTYLDKLPSDPWGRPYQYITRLTDMGIEPFLLSSSLLGVLAQRLVRKFCLSCQGRGCEACGGAGYQGRTGIFELLRVSDSVRQLIHDRAGEPLLRDNALQLGMLTLREDGQRLVELGITSAQELLRVTRE